MIKGIFVQETNPSDNIVILLCLRGAALWNRLHDLLLCFVRGLQLWLPHPCKSMAVKVWVGSPHTERNRMLGRERRGRKKRNKEEKEEEDMYRSGRQPVKTFL